MRLQHGVAALVAAGIFVLAYTLLSPSGAPAYYSMLSKKRDLEKRIALLSDRMEIQTAKIALLAGTNSHSHAYLEQIARREYGFVGKKETLLILH
jgi:cell division protein FtsB